jgi:hypothetical protein
MKAAKVKLGVLLTTALVGSLALVVSPSANAHFAESRISLHVDDHKVKGNEKVLFFGKLRNTHRKCRAGEEVELVRRNSGVVDVDVTDSDGEFSFTHDPDPNRGRFFARYKGHGKFGYNNKHRCSNAVSDPVRIRRG